MAAVLCGGISKACQGCCDCMGQVCLAPFKLCGACCEGCSQCCNGTCTAVTDCCSSNFCCYITVTCALNIPPIVVGKYCIGIVSHYFLAEWIAVLVLILFIGPSRHSSHRMLLFFFFFNDRFDGRSECGGRLFGKYMAVGVLDSLRDTHYRGLLHVARH